MYIYIGEFHRECSTRSFLKANIESPYDVSHVDTFREDQPVFRSIEASSAGAWARTGEKKDKELKLARRRPRSAYLKLDEGMNE
jgi:hypothetical protein